MIVIQVLGVGCNACRRMEADVQAVVAQLGLNARVEKVDDIEEITRFGLFVLPGLAVNGKVVAAGYSGRGRIERLLSQAAVEGHV